MRWLQRLAGRRPRAPAAERRWVVLDVEASSLDAAHGRLLAIGAVGVHIDRGRAHIALADSFEVVLRQPLDTAAPDKANILLHGIGVAAQRGGVEPAPAIDAFTGYLGCAPLLGFHVAFDRTLIERTCAALSVPPPEGPWLDLEPLAAVLLPQVKARSLDDWIAHFGIRCLQRHHAAADALATAELLLHLWPRLRAEEGIAVDAAIALAAQRRWLVSR
ncbi:MAG TPA: 3'-5' exonuclease [Burkholderiaceae bacterium]|jgi:DNA polymerase-3 subunit epsilon